MKTLHKRLREVSRTRAHFPPPPLRRGEGRKKGTPGQARTPLVGGCAHALAATEHQDDKPKKSRLNDQLLAERFDPEREHYTAAEQEIIAAALEREIADAKANLARQYPDIVLPPGYDYSEPAQ